VGYKLVSYKLCPVTSAAAYSVLDKVNKFISHLTKALHHIASAIENKAHNWKNSIFNSKPSVPL
jgi:hypothetical protein